LGQGGPQESKIIASWNTQSYPFGEVEKKKKSCPIGIPQSSVFKKKKKGEVFQGGTTKTEKAVFPIGTTILAVQAGKLKRPAQS